MQFPRFLVFGLLATIGCGTSVGDRSRLHHPDLNLAEVARSEDPDNRIFSSYNPNGPVQWNQGWPWKFDLSGVAWDRTRTATAITPRHVVMAAHFMRKTGDPLVFHDRKGRVHRRTLIKRVTFKERGKTADIGVGLLDRPLPGSIRTYPLPEPKRDYRPLINGSLAMVTDQKRRLYFHRIQQAGETALRLSYDKSLAPSRRKRLVSGDSGNPTFVLTAGELALVGTHALGGPGVGPFYGSLELQETLRKIVRDLDPAYTIRTVPIDPKVLKESAESGFSKPKDRPPPSNTSNPQAQPQPQRTPRPRTVAPATE